MAFLLFFASIFFLCLSDFTPKTYVIDVDGTAEDRWKEACEDYGAIAKEVLPIMLDLIPQALIPEFTVMAMEYYENYMQQEPYKNDIDYMAKCVDIPLDQAVLVNLVYDFSAWCTSIVVEDINGNILHGRNQDYPPPLRNDTIDVVFVSSKNGNKTVFTGTTFFGYVGMPTGVHPNGFSVTIDARFLGSRIEANLEAIHKGYFPSGWLVREVLTTVDDYDTAYDMFSNTDIMAPIYYILAGTDGTMNGSVITRNETDSIKPFLLADSEYDWFIIETNYNWWQPAPPSDDRRDAAIKNLNSIGQENINFDNLFWVLSQPPVLNSDTCYTTLMAPSQPNYYNTTVRTYEGAEHLPIYFRYH